MQQNIQRLAAKHDLSPETATELSAAMQGYMNAEGARDSVAAGEMTQEEAMGRSQMNRTEIQAEIAETAGEDVAIEMGGMLGGGAPGDAQGNMGGPPGMPPGGWGPHRETAAWVRHQATSERRPAENGRTAPPESPSGAHPGSGLTILARERYSGARRAPSLLPRGSAPPTRTSAMIVPDRFVFVHLHKAGGPGSRTSC